jgi:galactokinase
VTFFVPGRLEVFGKHTDYAGGHTLIAAVPRGFTVDAEPSSAGTVTVVDRVLGETAVFNPREALPGLGWRRYPATVIRRLAANFPEANLSASISFSSDLPPAAGLSSSSALIIAIAESLVVCAGLEATEAWQRDIQTVEDRALYFGSIENGSTFGALAGDAGVGTRGGSEDHAAILMSRAGFLQQFSFAPLHRDRRVTMPEGWTFAIASSGVEAHKTGTAMAAFNRLADPALMRGDRLRHFVAEDARVIEAADAFAAGDIARIGRLAAESQRDADALLGNQVPETRALVALALNAGSAAASSFGAGWGGSVWALVRERESAAFLDRWLATYRDRFPGLESAGFLSPPGDGMHK